MDLASKKCVWPTALAVLSLGAMLTHSAMAESGAPPPPVIEVTDANGVDLLTQTWRATDGPSISTAGISWAPSGFGRQDNLIGGYEDGTVSLLGTTIDTDRLNGRQASISCTYPFDNLGTCTLVLGDGTRAVYDKTKRSNVGIVANKGVLTQVTKPDGEILTYTYQSFGPYPQSDIMIYWQILTSVQSSLGWQVRYTGGQTDMMNFKKVYIVNSSIDYCDPTSPDMCVATDSGTWPYLELITTLPKTGYTNALGQATRLSTYVSWTGPTNYFYAAEGIAYPSGRGRGGTLDPNDGYKIANFYVGSSVWHYSNPKLYGGVDDRTTATDPSGHTKVLIHEVATTYLHTRRPLSYQDELGRITKWAYTNTTMGVTRVISPGATYSGTTLTGGYTDYVYDARNNVTSVSVVPEGGGAPLVTLANYPSTCADPKSCNKPTWVKDPKGNQTDFTYDTTGAHGGVLTETGPADKDGVRPQKRYGYTLLYPKVKNSSNVLVNSTPVWRLTSVSTCAVATVANPASCVGTANETKITYAYANNNLLKTSETLAAGDGSVSLTTSYGYDSNGRQIWVDGPRTDVDDKSYTTYDLLGRPIFEISPDPDATGPLKRLITKHNYDVDGHDYLVQSGYGTTTNGSDFAVTSSKRNTYDAATGLLVKTEVVLP